MTPDEFEVLRAVVQKMQAEHLYTVVRHLYRLSGGIHAQADRAVAAGNRGRRAVARGDVGGAPYERGGEGDGRRPTPKPRQAFTPQAHPAPMMSP